MNNFPGKTNPQNFHFPHQANESVISNLTNIIHSNNFDENDYFLLLSIYFYMKQNGYSTTADILFKEAELGNV